MSRIKEHLHSCIEKDIFPGAAYVVGTSKGIIDRGVVGSKGIDCADPQDHGAGHDSYVD